MGSWVRPIGEGLSWQVMAASSCNFASHTLFLSVWAIVLLLLLGVLVFSVLFWVLFVCLFPGEVGVYSICVSLITNCINTQDAATRELNSGRKDP